MNMRRIECILLCLSIGILSMAAQTRTVTGSVFDKADNQPVIGATIAVMSAQGTVRMARQPTWTVSSNWKYPQEPKT